MELHCGSRIHGVIVNGMLEVKCRSKTCGAGSGNVVLHYFSLEDGSLKETRNFRSPDTLFGKKKEEEQEQCP